MSSTRQYAWSTINVILNNYFAYRKVYIYPISYGYDINKEDVRHMNFLEQLIAEWYAYQGYFVRTNIKFGRRELGGYKGEIDVVAFDPKSKTLTHLEASGAADKWEKRQEGFKRKFMNASEYYNEIFDFEFEDVIKIAVTGYSPPKNPITLGDDIKLVLVSELMREITKEIKEINPLEKIIPEGYPLLRAIQFAVWLGCGGCAEPKK